MPFPENLEPADAFIRDNFRYPDGREPSTRTKLSLKKELPIVRYLGFEFVDVDKFRQQSRQQLEPEQPRRGRGRPKAAATYGTAPRHRGRPG